MGDEELTGYIIRSREKGRTREQIIRALYSVGWKKEKVEAAFQKLDGSKNWQKDGAAPPPQTQQQGKVNEPNAATPQQMQMLQQSRQQKQSAPVPAPAAAPPPQQPAAQAQPPIDLQPPGKKPLFALPAIFQKKQQQQSEPAHQPASQKKPFALPNPFEKKSGQPVSQPASNQPDAQPLQAPQAAPQKAAQPQQPSVPPAQSAQPTPPPAVKETTTQPAEREAERQAPSEGVKAAPGLLPPKTTFTISTQQVSFGSAQATAKPAAAGNPAFSNLASAAASAASRKSFLPSVVLAAILLLAIGYYFFQMRSPEIPQVDGPRIELNKTDSKTANTTKPPVLQNTTKKPVVTPPKNTSKTNVSQPPVKQNGTSQAKNSTPQNTTSPAKNTTTQPSNTSVQSGEQSGTQRFSSHSVFYSSENEPPSKFCQNKNAALYRVHYLEYYGTNCLNYKNKDGYSFPIDFPYACDSIPCCYNDVSSSFSRKYDSFECGYYES